MNKLLTYIISFNSYKNYIKWYYCLLQKNNNNNLEAHRGRVSDLSNIFLRESNTDILYSGWTWATLSTLEKSLLLAIFCTISGCTHASSTASTAGVSSTGPDDATEWTQVMQGRELTKISGFKDIWTFTWHRIRLLGSNPNAATFFFPSQVYWCHDWQIQFVYINGVQHTLTYVYILQWLPRSS